MVSQDIINLEKKYCANNYDPLPVVLSKGNGIWVWDVEERKFLDMLSGYSALSHGHCHPKIVQTISEQAGKLTLTSRAFHSNTLAIFLEKLCKIAFMEKALPMNSGAEAVETAIKGARRWGYHKKKIPENQAEIIVAKYNFHGRTTTIVGFSSEPSYREGFGPFTPGFVEVPFGDAEALKSAITDKTCAFLVEPVQGEGGILFPPEGYLKKAEEICREKNVLLILDEIQVGLGRTGKMFAFQHENVKPDGLIVGKALGGGVYPISAFLAKNEVMEVFDPGSHGSTFGGNPLAAAIGLKALEILEEEKLVERSKELGAYMKEKMESYIKYPLVKEVRGKGLFIGLELREHARPFCNKLLEKGILTYETHEVTVRFAPPLVITKEDIDWSLERIEETLAS